MSRADLSAFAKLDPCHVTDGLFVPKVKKGEALYEVEGEYDGGAFSFKGVQLGPTHQSVLLAVAARIGRLKEAKALVVKALAGGAHAELASAMAVQGAADDQAFARIDCTAYALMTDAGMSDSAEDYQKLIELLHDMSTVVLYRQKGGRGGLSKLLTFNHQLDKFSVAINWRLTSAIFGSHNVHVSLHERRELSSSPVAKILHTWLSSAIRPGGQLMAGKGAGIDALVRHVYGKRPCSDAVLRKRRQYVREALHQIARLEGWAVTLEGLHHAYVSRPKLSPFDAAVLPGDLAEVEAEIGRQCQFTVETADELLEGARTIPPSAEKAPVRKRVPRRAA